MRGQTPGGLTPLGLRDKLRGRLKSLVNFKGTPHELALAFGLGVALGIIPATGAIVAAAVATVLRLNLAIMVAGALLTNPITTPLVYSGSFLLGHWLLGDLLPEGAISSILLGTVTGNLVLAAGLGVSGYLVVLGIALGLRRSQTLNSSS